MKRREFLKTAAATTAALGCPGPLNNAAACRAAARQVVRQHRQEIMVVIDRQDSCPPRRVGTTMFQHHSSVA
ncbi:twin-arginine translocation signal domain-containing protein [bacterium]|nr:twin-arginine translocation signal domain-containing protein [bacterium]